MQTSPSKLLMPLSFASMFGGVCTLIGTSTNLLVNAIAIDHGHDAFGMFEFAPIGVVLLAAGLGYLFVAVRFIPERLVGGGQDLTERFEVAPYITQVALGDGAPGVGETVSDNVLVRNLDLDIIDVRRDGQDLSGVAGQLHLQQGDVLRVRAGAREIQELLALEGVALMRPAEEQLDAQIKTERDTLIEAVIAPDSQLGRQTVGEVNFPGRHGAQVLAVRQHGEVQRHDLRDLVLQGGNSLLLKIDRERLAEFQDQEDFVVVSEVVVPHIRRRRIPHALAIIAAVVGLAAFGVLPIVVSAVAGCLAMVAVGCLTAEEAYDAINWKVVFLLAGVIPLGVALDKTGGAQLLADWMVGELSAFGPAAVLSALFLVTQLLTAIGAAEGLGVAARPFLVAVTVAASMSFMTPVGYQTNTLIYGPGQYRFSDFVKIGTPLNFVAWIVASISIPLIWPF